MAEALMRYSDEPERVRMLAREIVNILREADMQTLEPERVPVRIFSE